MEPPKDKGSSSATVVGSKTRVNEILLLLEAKVIFSSSHLHGNLSGQSIATKLPVGHPKLVVIGHGNPPENLLKIQV